MQMNAPPPWVLVTILGIVAASTVWRLAELRTRAGISAFVAPADTLLEWLLAFILIAASAFVIAFAVYPPITDELGPFHVLEQAALAWFGAVLGVAGALLVAVAQFGMGLSWRIGVPKNETNRLVTDGLYRLSRNPIYLGMLIALIGIFLVAPNAATQALLVAGWIVMSAQIRIEEEFLGRAHGPTFDTYRAATRRWI